MSDSIVRLQFQSHAETIVPPAHAGADAAWNVVTPGLTATFESQQSPDSVAKPLGGVVIVQKPDCTLVP